MSRIVLLPPATWIDQPEGVRRLAKELVRKGQPVAFDTEATSLVNYKTTPVIWSASDGEARWCFPAPALHDFREVWESRSIPKVGWNLKYDLWVLHNYGIEVEGELWDGIVADWLDDENRLSHKLKDRSAELLGTSIPEFKELFGDPKKAEKEGGDSGTLIRKMMSTPEGKARAIDYASLDALATHRIVFRYLMPRMKKERMYGRSVWDWFLEVEAPITKILWDMEVRGTAIDIVQLRELKKWIEGENMKLYQKLSEIIKTPLNMGSTKQLGSILFGVMDVPTRLCRKTSTGVPSIDEDGIASITQWAKKEDRKDVLFLCKCVMEFRHLNKIGGTYTDPLILSSDENYRIHTTLNQHITVTGRLSSSDPALQNIPIKTELGKKIRQAFIPGEMILDDGTEETCILIAGDYKQLEMRILAHMAEDERMIRAIISGKDLHAVTAAEMMGYVYEEIVEAVNKKDRIKEGSKEQLSDKERALVEARRGAKTIGFGLVYGEGAAAVGEDLGIPKEEAARLISAFMDARPGVRAFVEGTKEACYRNLYVQTFTGRKRRLPTIRSMDRGDAAYAQRQSVNSRIQGSAADIAKMAMIKCTADPRLKKLNCRILLQIHDELLCEMPNGVRDAEKIKEAKQLISHNMSTAVNPPLLVPLDVDIHSGFSWSAVH